MKVTLVSTRPDVTSGTGQYAAHLADPLDERVDVERVFYRTDSADPLYFVRQTVAAARSRSDVVHVQFDYVLFGPRGLYVPLVFGLLWLLTRRRGQSVVVTVHEVITPALVTAPFASFKGAYAGFLNRILVWCSDHLVFLSPQAETRFTDHVTTENRSVLSHGVVRTPPESMDQATARSAFGYDPDDVVVVEPGYVSERKGSDLLVTLAERCPEFEFLLAGGAPRDRHATFVESIRARAPDNLAVTGHLADERFHAAFVGADLIVLPYRETAQTGVVNVVNQSGVFNWAMAHRKPVAASDCDRFRAVAEQWGTPVLFDPDDPAEVEQSVRDLLADPARRDELRAACDAYLDANDMATVADEHVALYREVTA